MIRIILAFLFVFGLFFFGIDAYRNMTGQEKMDLTNLVCYSLMCAILTVITLAIIVLSF